MSEASEQLQIVRLLADGTYMWREPLSAPGSGRSALLLDLLASDAIGASEFEITASGDWVATVAGRRYNVLPGIIPDTGRFVFIGAPAPVRTEPPPVIPPIPPILDPKEYSDDFNRANGDPGPTWSLFTDGAAYLSIVNNELTATAANEEQLGWWNLPLPAGVQHHKVQVTVGSAVPTVTYLLLRASETDGHVRALFHDSGVLEILSGEGALIGGTLTPRADVSSIPLIPRQVLSVEAEGPDYVARVDGDERLRWTDAALEWPHVDDGHLNVAVGCKLASLKSRVLTSRAGTGMAIDDFAASHVDYEESNKAFPRFTGGGALAAILETKPSAAPAFAGVGALSALADKLGEVTPQFAGEGALTAVMTQAVVAAFTGDGALAATAITGPVDLSGEGSLSATVWDVLTPAVTADFTGDGTLSATAEEVSLEPTPQFSGDGSLTARVTTYPKPISHFTFYEGSGVCARSLVGGYRLDLNDADTGWHGKAIKGPTWGVVGEPGVNNEWSVALQLTYNSATSDGPAILENHYEASTTHFSVGFDKRGGAAYPGVFVPTAVAGSQWVYSPTPIPLGTPHTLVCTCSVTDAAAKLYLDGVEILTVAGQTLIHRDFANSASLFDYSFNPDAYLDEVTYWDVCLTPEDVAALPPAAGIPMSDFDFRERSGPTAASLLGSYTLTAADPTTAWDNASAVTQFSGVVGAALQDEWTVALDLTLEAVMASRAAGLSILESATECVIGLNHAGGFAFPGLKVGGGSWQFSTTGLPLGTPRKLVCVGSGAATTLYLDGVPVVTAAAQARDFAAATTLLDDQSAASVDNVSYWDEALSPEQVAGLSPIGPSRFTPISNFDFREGEGATAASTRGAYVLAATDPATAWKGQEAQGEFTGLVGKGAFSKWSMAMTLTLDAVGTADEVIEEARESSGTLTFALGFRYTSGQAFPGFYCSRTGVGGWTYSTTPFPVGAPYTLAFVSDQSDAFTGCRLFLNGGVILEDDTYMCYRYYGEPAELLGPEKPDASVDNVTYWDIALTPAEVADIPEPVEPPLLPKTADAQFSGGGTLGQETTRASMANFDFHEAGGDTAHSLVGDYTLTATDPDTAWHEASAAGRFDGVVGTGTQAEWSALFSLTLNAVNATDGPSRLEITWDELDEYQSTIGFNHVGGVAYPGLQLGLDPWVYSTTPFSVGVVHQLICVGSAEAGTTTLYLDGVDILSLPKVDNARYFDVLARLMDNGYPQDAWLDNATYLDFAMTPEEVAAIPSNHVIARLDGEGTLEAFVEDYAWYHDSFNRPDGPPGASWLLTHTTPATADLVIAGNELTIGGVNEAEFGWWNRALPGPDHKVEVRVGRNIPSFIKLMVRSSQTNGWAEAQFNPSTGQVWICTFEGAWMGIGGVAERDERSGFTIADGTLISMEVIGPHYTARVNGAVAGHWYDIMNEWPHNDASHVNVGVSVQGVTGVGVDYFKATDLTGVPVQYPIHGSDDFERPDGPLGADWTVKHIWETITATVKNGQLWQSGNGTTQYIWAAPLPGDDMSIEFTKGDGSSSGYLIRLRYGDNLWQQVKSNVIMMEPYDPNQAEYFGPSIATQGSPTDGGMSRAGSGWDYATDPGSTILFEAVGQWYVVSVDGRQRVSWKDTGGIVPIGADRRHVLIELSGSTDPAYAEDTVDNVVITNLHQPVDETLVGLDE